MIHYIDSCALLKLTKIEAESTALRAWIKSLGADDSLATSELAELELTRSLTRFGVPGKEVAERVGGILDFVDVASISQVILRTAISYRIRRLGTLDSIHLATAEFMRSGLRSFVTYDKELAAAAEEQGLEVVAPGA
jgi:predicted nucleic acid-binding protein